ncbi:MAG: sigma factor, partial [Bacteroidota bacterium]
MKDKNLVIASFYRRYYGQLFSALTAQYGTKYVIQIEDAIQNAFYKSLKLWKADAAPENKKNWLFIVAKNDLLNQLKQKENPMFDLETLEQLQEDLIEEDLRLK